MNEQPITFHKSKDINSARVEPSTCVDAEPYALQVLDDSMAPEFWQGCVILIDPTGRATNGSYVLAIDSISDDQSQNHVFRQLTQHSDETYTLDALNTDYRSIQTNKDLSQVVGVIVQRAGKRRHQHKRYD